MADNFNDPSTRGAEEDILSRLQQLPEDIREDILFRLPASTLGGMRRLCRTFRAWIDKPGFATAHCSPNNAVSCKEGTHMIGFQSVCSDQSFLMGGLFEISDGGESFRSIVKGQAPVGGFNPLVAGAADGLVVLQHFEYSVHSFNPWGITQLTLWNPLLGTRFVIPRSPKQLELRASADPDRFPQLWLRRQEGLQVHVGFGHDTVNKDYKVVVVVVESDTGSLASCCSWLEVYHVKSNLWRTYVLGYHKNVIWGNNVCVQRTIHWIMGLCHGRSEERIVIEHNCVASFDPDTLSIIYTEFPQGFGVLVRVPVLCNGSLALFTVSSQHTRLHVLKEDGNWVVEWSQSIGNSTAARFKLLAALQLEGPKINNAIFLPEQNFLLISRHGQGFISFNFLNNRVQFLDGASTFMDTFRGSLLWRDLLPHTTQVQEIKNRELMLEEEENS